MAPRSLTAMVLAAGEGTRMRSLRPKPLHRLCGRPMVLHVLDALSELAVERVVVVIRSGAEAVVKAVQESPPPGLDIGFVEQRSPLGTGDAVATGLAAFVEDDVDDDDIVVLPSDTPLLRAPTVAALVRGHRESGAAATVLTAVLPAPAGYGRVVRDERDGHVARIVEDLDASPEERAIQEVNTSIYCFRRGLLAPAIRRIDPENAQGECYLTDTIAVLHDAGHPVDSLVVGDPMEAAGVNDLAQLAVAEAELRDRTNERWMRRGVTMLDPERTYVDASVDLDAEVTLYPGTILQGSTSVGRGARVGPDAWLVDCNVGEEARVSQSSASQAEIGVGARVGPYAVLEPGSRVAPGAVTGPFFRGRVDGEDGG